MMLVLIVLEEEIVQVFEVALLIMVKYLRQPTQIRRREWLKEVTGSFCANLKDALSLNICSHLAVEVVSAIEAAVGSVTVSELELVSQNTTVPVVVEMVSADEVDVMDFTACESFRPPPFFGSASGAEVSVASSDSCPLLGTSVQFARHV